MRKQGLLPSHPIAKDRIFAPGQDPCHKPVSLHARMAELVDALVSKTNEVTLVPVRSRLRVPGRSYNGFAFFMKNAVSLHYFTIHYFTQ
jgi:hypothetical protein